MAEAPNTTEHRQLAVTDDTIDKYEAQPAPDSHHFESLAVPCVSNAQFQDVEVVGRGSHFVVSRATVRSQNNSTQPVAVKRVLSTATATDAVRAALREARAMDQCKHANVIQLVALDWEDGQQHKAPALVVELALGNLRQLLRGKVAWEGSEQVETWKLKTQFAADIAGGLLCLHNFGIVHGDVRAAKILVFRHTQRSSGLVAKVADFAFSVADPPELAICRAVGAREWKAPECLSGAPSNLACHASGTARDVYSFGVTLWEIANSGATPFDDVGEAELDDMKLDDAQTAFTTLIMSLPADCPDCFSETLFATVQNKPGDRETFSLTQQRFLDPLDSHDTSLAPPSLSTAEVRHESSEPEATQQVNHVLYTVHLAAALNNANGIRALVRAGESISARHGQTDETPLHTAARFLRLDSVKTLLELGADVNSTAKDGETPLHFAVRAATSTEVIQFVAGGTNAPRIPEVDKSAQAAVIEALLAAGADVCKRGEHAFTPLHFACFKGLATAARTLLENPGRSVFLSDEDGDTPLHLLVYVKDQPEACVELASLLLHHGADLYARNVIGQSALQYAFDKENSALADLLMQAGADPSLREAMDVIKQGFGRFLHDMSQASGDSARVCRGGSGSGGGSSGGSSGNNAVASSSRPSGSIRIR